MIHRPPKNGEFIMGLASRKGTFGPRGRSRRGVTPWPGCGRLEAGDSIPGQGPGRLGVACPAHEGGRCRRRHPRHGHAFSHERGAGQLPNLSEMEANQTGRKTVPRECLSPGTTIPPPSAAASRPSRPSRPGSSPASSATGWWTSPSGSPVRSNSPPWGRSWRWGSWWGGRWRFGPGDSTTGAWCRTSGGRSSAGTGCSRARPSASRSGP